MTDFHLLIRDWYRQNKRSLPWRETNDPYKIWLSEVILQQTRVDQGLAYYHKFIKEFPTVELLSRASEQEILSNWQGLGYYSRARNLHHTAKTIVCDYDGVFPEKYLSIKSLKGVGDYTAAAIASFAFNEVVPVVDGNVYRVLSRIFDIDTPIDSSLGKRMFKDLAAQLIDKKNPGEFNQAIMEFGALQCTPKNPNCQNCIFSTKCLALMKNIISNRPVKANKTKVKSRFFHYLVLKNENKIVLKKRTQKDIWQSLYEFPLVETTDLNAPKEFTLAISPDNATFISEEVIHILSHQRIHARFYHFPFPKEINPEEYIIVDLTNIGDYPLPRLIDKYLEKIV